MADGTPGRRAYAPTPKDRAMVLAMSGFGIPDYEIARVLGISAPTMRKYFDLELATGHVKANAKVAEKLYQKATGDGQGSVVAAIFWLKCRAGWNDRSGEVEIGKKEQANITAKTAGHASEWGEDLTFSGPRPN